MHICIKVSECSYVVKQLQSGDVIYMCDGIDFKTLNRCIALAEIPFNEKRDLLHLNKNVYKVIDDRRTEWYI